MFVENGHVGVLNLSAVFLIFGYYTIWVIGLPFVDPQVPSTARLPDGVHNCILKKIKNWFTFEGFGIVILGIFDGHLEFLRPSGIYFPILVCCTKKEMRTLAHRLIAS
jgi:hypothetical protein